MKFLSTLPAFILVAMISSCGSSSSKENTSTEFTPSPTPTAIKDTIPVQPSTAIIPAPNVTQANTPVTGKAGLNPEHGKPGHRCDIAVGAPLDSKPNQPEINTNQQPGVTKNTQAVTIPANTQPVTVQKNPIVINPGNAGVTAAGMNPEHGKPGHRCDIAVGAPLNSKPTVATQPVINTNPQPVVKQTAPTLTSPPVVPTNTTTTAPGLNPEHGKPGHRCDIAVGAPLNSKPK